MPKRSAAGTEMAGSAMTMARGAGARLCSSTNFSLPRVRAFRAASGAAARADTATAQKSTVRERILFMYGFLMK
jgi:hypothetical protein